MKLFVLSLDKQYQTLFFENKPMPKKGSLFRMTRNQISIEDEPQKNIAFEYSQDISTLARPNCMLW
jgi:hypothetical protein